MASSSVILD